MADSLTNYWRLARAPRYSLTFALPLLVAYEVLAFSLSHDEVTGVRNGADVLLKSVFLALGGRNGLLVFGALLVGGGAWLVWQDYRRGGSLDPRVFGLMAAGVDELRARLRHGDRYAHRPAAPRTHHHSVSGLSGSLEPADAAHDLARRRNL